MILESVALIRCTCLPSGTEVGRGGELDRKRGKLAAGEGHRQREGGWSAVLVSTMYNGGNPSFPIVGTHNIQG